MEVERKCSELTEGFAVSWNTKKKEPIPLGIDLFDIFRVVTGTNSPNPRPFQGGL